jgi:penicillin amidase
MNGLTHIIRAKGWDDYVEGVTLFRAPQQKSTYADVEGNIGNYITGRVPIRAKGDGRLPVPGWTGEFEWIDEIPFEKMPHSFNPRKGYIVTANNQPLRDPKYPYYLSSIWDPGYRATILSRSIENANPLTKEDCKKMHANLDSLPGKDFVKLLENFESHDPDVQLALQLLRNWNFILTPDSIGGTIYEFALDEMIKVIFKPELGEKLAFEFAGTGFHPLLKATTDFFHNALNMLFHLLKTPDSTWIQNAGGKDEVINRSLKQSILYLRTTLGPNSKNWNWGNINKITFDHAMSMQKPLDKIFNVGPYPIGGDRHTPNQQGSPYGDKSKKCWVPSYRQIVDLGDLSKSWVVYAPGQSGNLASTHYRDLFEYWYKIDYIPMLWTREQVEQNLEALLTLKSM